MFNFLLRPRALLVTAVLVASIGLTGAAWLKLWPFRAARLSSAATHGPSVRLGGMKDGTWQYDLELTADAGLAGSRILGYRLRGRLNISPISLTGGLLRFRLEQAQLEQSSEGNAEGAAALPELQQQLGEPFDCEIGSRGELRQVWFPSGIDPLVSRLLRMVLVHSQVVVPEHGLSLYPWEVEESDLAGKFRVAYVFDPESGSLKKGKRGFIQIHPGAGLGFRAVDIRINRSQGVFQVNKSGSITDVDYSEDLTLIMQTGVAQGIDARSTTHVSLKNGAPISDEPILLAAATPPRTAQSPYAETPPQPRNSATDAERIGGRSLRDVIGALRGIDRASSQGRQDTARLYIATTALFRRNPEALSQAKAVILKNDKEALFLISALGDAGSQQSAVVLSDLLKSTQEVTTKRAILEALGHIRGCPG